MTRASLRTLAAVFLLGAALAPAAALAQSANSSFTGTPLVSQSATLNNNLPQISTDGTVSAGQNNPTNVTTNASTLNGQTQSQQPAPSANAPVNNSLNKGEPTSLDSLLEWVVQIFAGIVYIAGTALNVAAYYSIVKMGDLVGQLSPLQVAWGVFRDLGNIAILFGFIAAGIMMILDVGSYGSKKMIVTLIIVAVAINFSSLAARAVIDAGNIVGIQFYKAFNNGAIPTGNISDNGISDHLMDSVKLTTLYDQSQSGAVANYPLIAFMSIILFLVVSFVFFSIAFLLVSRFVILVFLITISPLAFAGYVIPAFKKRSDEWLNTLIKNTLVAPVVLLLLLVSTKIVTSGTFTNQLGNNGWTNALPNGLASTGATSIGNVIILFMIACGFYLASLIIGKQLSTFGAGVVTTAGSYLQKTATNNLVRRPAGFVGRHSLGWAGAGAGRALRTVAPISGQRLIDASKKAKFGGLDSTASLEAERKHAKEEIRKEDVERGAKARLKTAKSDMSDAQKERDAAIARGDTAAREDADHKISSALGRLSQQEVEDLDDIKKGTEALVQNLSPQQFKNLMESKTLSEEEKTKVREARFADVNASIAKAKSSGTPADIEAAKKQLNGLTTKELEYAGQSFLEDDFVAENLTDKQYEDLSKGDALSPTAKRALKTKRESRFDASAPDAAVASRIIGMKGDIDQIGKIPPAALERPGVLASLGLREFDAIRRANKVSAATRQIIGAHLNTRIDPDISRYLLTDPRAMQYFLM